MTTATSTTDPASTLTTGVNGSDINNIINAAGLFTSKDVTTNSSNSGGTNTDNTVDSGQTTTSTTNNSGNSTSSTTSNTGSVNTIVNSGSVNSTSNTSKTSNSGRTDTSQLQISQEGVDRLVQSMLGGSQGLAAITSGQHTAGLYNSTTNQLLSDDLLARVSGEIASRTGVLVNKTGASSTTTRGSSKQVIGGSSVTNTTGPSSATTDTTTGPSTSSTSTVSGPRTVDNTKVIGPTTSSSEQYAKAPINPATALGGLTALQFIAKYGKSMYDAVTGGSGNSLLDGASSLLNGGVTGVASGLGDAAASSAIAGGVAAGATDAAAIGASTAAEVGAAMGADAAGAGATMADVDALWGSVMGDSAAGGAAVAGGLEAGAAEAGAAEAGGAIAAEEGGAAAAGSATGAGFGAYFWPAAIAIGGYEDIRSDGGASSQVKTADWTMGLGGGSIEDAIQTDDPAALAGPLKSTVKSWIICTELKRQNRMNIFHYIYGAREFDKYDEHGKKGYYIWAVPSVRHLRKDPNSLYSKLLETVFCARAEYLAAVGGYRKAKKTLFGAAVTHSTYAMCWILSRTIARNYNTPAQLDTLNTSPRIGVPNGSF